MPGTVGIVLVSHSRTLAEATCALARQMAGSAARIAIAAGAGDEHEDIGTDATAIMAAIESLDSPAGTLVLMDLGSAILSAETALDLIDPDIRARVLLCAAPFVEGALAAATTATAGVSLSAVGNEARGALGPKRVQLGERTEAAAQIPAAAASETSSIRTVTITDPAGLHLRPASEITRVVREHNVNATLAPAEDPGKRADAASLTSMLSLGLRAGTVIQVEARGQAAEAALNAIERVLIRAAGDEPETGRPNAQESGPSPASPGIAIGPAITLRLEFPQLARTRTQRPDKAQAALDAALNRARAEIDPGVDAILAAQRDLLEDPALREKALALIDSQHLEAAPAWSETILEMSEMLQSLGDPVLRARAVDLRDAGLRVLGELGIDVIKPLENGAPAIVVAEDLFPSQVATFDRQRVIGVIDRAGGPTSHAAIMLRAKGIPAVVGASALGDVPDGTELAIDGTEGKIWRDPDDETRQNLEARRAAERSAAAEISGIIICGDGTRAELWANVASVEESAAARRADARGIGLFRTEFLFLDRAEAPDEDEQAAQIAAVLAPMRGLPVHVRTLDAGADKPIAFLKLRHETNPYLGLRGIRATLAHPDLFSSQLRAILRAGTGHDLGIMLPMVTDPGEISSTQALLDNAHRDLVAEGVPHAWPVRLGMMVEVPAAALRIAEFKDICAFYSVGTNDLTQYVLAADRGNSQLARFHRADHPAVLALCRKVASEGGRPVSVCGEAAGDPRIAESLIRAGIHSLSMAPTLFGAIRASLQK